MYSRPILILLNTSFHIFLLQQRYVLIPYEEYEDLLYTVGLCSSSLASLS